MDYSTSGLLHIAPSKIIKFTESLCPACVSEGKYQSMMVGSIIYGEEGKVWLGKFCPEHGWMREELLHKEYDLLARGFDLITTSPQLARICVSSFECGPMANFTHTLKSP